MTRDEKIIDFFKNNDRGLRWCEPDAKGCACMGCINGSLRRVWMYHNPNEAPITKEEFDRLSPGIKPRDSLISFIFGAHPALERRSREITLLEAYSKFLESQGYLDTDWRTEAPYAIDEFLKSQKP